MLELIAPLLPRHPYEAASSIANDLFGLPPPPRAGARPSADLAFGTVSWPLRKLEELGNGFYGDAEHLVQARTLLNYGRFAMRPEPFERVRRRAIDGVISRTFRERRSDLRAPMICPLCRTEELSRYGTHALLWPHQAALVEACWEHGVCLMRANARANVQNLARGVVKAPIWEVEFARDVVSVCEMGRDIDAAIDNIVARIRDAGFQYESGWFCRGRLFESFKKYMEQVQSPLLQALVCNENAICHIMRFITRNWSNVPPYSLALFLGFLRKAGSTAVTVLPIPHYAKRHFIEAGTWSASLQPKLGQPERHDALALRLKGYSEAAVAEMKGLSQSALAQRVLRSGRAADIKQARFAFLRRTARAAWRATWRLHGTVGVTIIERRAYCWLRAHDREWLSSHSSYAPRVHGTNGSFRLPEQQARIAADLQDAIVTLVQLGHRLPLPCRTVLGQASIPEAAFRKWMLFDEAFARAMRPFFHPEGIQAPKVLRERLLAL